MLHASSRGPLALAVALLALAGCRGGCGRSTGRGVPASGLELVPAETRIVGGIDFARVRGTSLWKGFARLATEDPRDRKMVEELRARTGLDPFTQIHQIFVAFPEDARTSGAFAILLTGQGFDENRLVTYARERARLDGRELVSRRLRGHTLWADGRAGGPAGVFLDGGRFLLAGGGWAERTLDLLDGVTGVKSAAQDERLSRIAARVAKGRPLWLAALIPEAGRARLLADARLDLAPSITALSLGVQLGDGLVGELDTEFSNPDDARRQTEKILLWIARAKVNPAAVLLGAGPYLDTVSAVAQGSTMQLRAVVPEPLVVELTSRLGALRALGRARGDRLPVPARTQ